MGERFDAIVIGAGPAGEVAASRLLKQGLSTALVERELVGGECEYWACIPSKTLLRASEAQAEARRVAGLDEPEADWQEIVRYRDCMIRDLDDSGAVAGYEKSGVTVVKGVQHDWRGPESTETVRSRRGPVIPGRVASTSRSWLI